MILEMSSNDGNGDKFDWLDNLDTSKYVFQYMCTLLTDLIGHFAFSR